jgi:PhnB protein
MRIETYLFFDGNCAEAMRFYESTLGGKLSLMPAKESPVMEHLPPGSGDKILHSKLETGGAVLMASDWMAAEPYPAVGGFAVTVTPPTLGEAKSTFDKLAAGGVITMPFGKTFYSDGFGMLVDRFGTSWMVMAATNEGS